MGVHPRDQSPSQRYRFEQFEPYLAAHGIEVEYAAALSPKDVTTFYGANPAHEKALVALRAMLRRGWSVRPRLVERFDAVFVQREAFFLLGAWSEWIASLQAPVLFDFDDAIWMHAVSEGNRRFRMLKNVVKIARVTALARTVIAGNDFLGTWARQHNSQVRVIPTCVNTERYVPGTRSTRQITIGWCGSPSTIPHLRLAIPVLRRVARRFGDRVRFRVMGDPTFRSDELGVVGERWTSASEIPFLQSLDIALMPLPDDEWSKGKCGLKALTSMACGAAMVASPVGVNPTIVRHGSNGFLPRDEAEWFDSLRTLVEDDALRTRMSMAGRETVVRDFSVARWREPLLSVITESFR